MSERMKFDRLKLSLPVESVHIIDSAAFTRTVSSDDNVIRMKYEQKTPFYYNVIIDCSRHSTTLEFSGKALLDDYPSLIDSTNIASCIEHINEYEICYINPEDVMERSYVLQCDVTADICPGVRVPVLYKNITLTNSRQWCIRETTGNRFTIENTAVTHRKKARLVVYDKEIEMNRSVNRPFLAAVSNSEYQLDYFRNKIRYELNLNSLDRIRKYFGIKNTSLKNLLNAECDPIAKFLEEAVAQTDIVTTVGQQSGNVRTLEHILLLALCNFDLTKVELVIRDLYGTSRSITRALQPYQKLIDDIRHNVAEPDKDLNFIDIRNMLRYMLSTTFSAYNNDNNLISLYESNLRNPFAYDSINTQINILNDIT